MSLWIPLVLLASLCLVIRNALQRDLSAQLGTLGATNVRFLFGVPFAFVLLALAALIVGDDFPRPTTAFWLWITLGSLCQIVATALTLVAMDLRSFVVATAYTKTEPVQAALFSFAFLHDPLAFWNILAVIVATAGVLFIAVRRGEGKTFEDPGAAMLGLAAGGAFAVSAVGYRGAILALSGISFVSSGTFVLVAALCIQALVLTTYLILTDRNCICSIVRLWRQSLLTGLMGALASELFLLGLALTSAANVRTLALVEVLFAQGISHYGLKQQVRWHELIGISLIVVGVALLLLF